MVCTLQRMMTRTTPKGHFTVMDEIEAEGDLVLIQTFLALLCKSSYSYAKHTVAFFKDNFHNKAKEVCIKTRSLSASQSFEG